MRGIAEQWKRGGGVSVDRSKKIHLFLIGTDCRDGVPNTVDVREGGRERGEGGSALSMVADT